MGSMMLKEYSIRLGWYSIFFITFTLIIFGKAVSQTSESQHFKIEKMSEGIYAAIHKPGGYAICNAGIVNLGEENLIFDTFISPEAASDLSRIAVELTGNPVRYVVNSHYHNDHIRGNQVFKPSATIISTETTRDLIAENEPQEILAEKDYAPKRLAQLKAEYEAENDDEKKQALMMWIGYFEAIVESHPILHTTLPDLTFSEKMVIHGSERDVELINFDIGHTTNDLILYLPDEEILFTGDLVFVGMHPFLADGNPENLVQALMQLKTFPLDKVLPGHGRVGTFDDINLMIEYVKRMNELIESLITQNMSSEELNEVRIPEPFANWEFSNFFRINLKFMYSQATPKNEN
jgi:glyoxylase-like metal-dependent hydrolase (beta-lactamase superfamily II)